MESSWQDRAFKVSTVFMLIGIVYWILYEIFHFNVNFALTPCILLEVFHIYCPGCGGTRAITALLNLDIITAIRCNPFIVYSAFFFLLYYGKTLLNKMTKGRIKPAKFRFSIMYIGVTIFLVFGIARNVLAIGYGIDYLGNIAPYWN